MTTPGMSKADANSIERSGISAINDPTEQGEMKMKDFWRDLWWAVLMFRIRRYRHECLFSKRTTFDKMMQAKTSSLPWMGTKAALAYPDAVYFYERKWFVEIKQKLDGLWQYPGYRQAVVQSLEDQQTP